jgi:hypothetical protein
VKLLCLGPDVKEFANVSVIKLFLILGNTVKFGGYIYIYIEILVIFSFSFSHFFAWLICDFDVCDICECMHICM